MKNGLLTTARSSPGLHCPEEVMMMMVMTEVVSTTWTPRRHFGLGMALAPQVVVTSVDAFLSGCSSAGSSKVSRLRRGPEGGFCVQHRRSFWDTSSVGCASCKARWEEIHQAEAETRDWSTTSSSWRESVGWLPTTPDRSRLS